MNGAREPRRRPIADFLYLAREQPNVALGWGLGALAVVVLVVFGIVRLSGGSSSSSTHAGANGAASAGPGSGGDGTGTGATGGTTSKSPGAKRGGSTGTSSTGKTDPTGGSNTNLGGGSANTPTTFVPAIPTTAPRGPELPLPKSAQRWVASPSNIHMKAGAFARGYVIVVNESDVSGTVASPGCSGPPSATAPTGPQSGPGATCHPGTPFVVPPHQSQKFMWTWHATQTGRAGAPPLAPGSYFFAIGPISVHVTVK